MDPARGPGAVAARLAFLALWLLAFQPATVTVADCLLRSGYSRAVPDTPITTLAGVDAWAQDGIAALTEGAFIGFASVDDSDGARRLVAFYAYAGSIFAFVFKHENDPGRRLPGEPSEVWHGDCMVRLISRP